MYVRFLNAQLRPVLIEAIANFCQLILVNAPCVYLISEKGERLNSGRQKHIAYAVGHDPDTEPSARALCSTSKIVDLDLRKFLDPKLPVFQHILDSEHDLMMSSTDTCLILLAVPACSPKP